MDKATPKEWIISRKYQYGGSGHVDKCYYASQSKQALADFCGGNKIGNDIHVIEKTPEVAKAVELHDEIVELLCNITKEQSIPDFDRSIAEARTWVNKRLTTRTPK